MIESPSIGPSSPATAAVAAYDALAEARLLLRCVHAGALATLTQEQAPFVSLVNVATLPDGSPILLMSRLAAHTRQLERDPRASLLLAQGGEGDPLSHPRLTISGNAHRADDPAERAALKARFLARHPKSSLYADFGNFSFWRIAIRHTHLNGGFGRTGNFSGAAMETSLDGADALVAAEAGAISHMNADHKDALALYAVVLAGKPDGAQSGAEWIASGIDPDGLDLIRGDETARIVFPQPVRSPEALRATLVELATKSRAIASNAAAGNTGR